ncbi:MAG: hypothetical protein OHK0046_40000 [Anaerolineae bacterium]
MINLTDKTALVIGDLESLTEEVAARLSAAGASVEIVPPDDLETRVASLSHIDIAVLHPNGWREAPFMQTTPDEWDAALQRNFETTVFAMQALARKMQSSGGSIVLLSSVVAKMPFANTSLPGTTLAMLWPVVKMAAVDLGGDGVRVNMVAYGWVETDVNREYIDDSGNFFFQADIPLGRMATPAEIGDVCCFLASDMARYITGTMITVDGGYTLTRSPGPSPHQSF